MFGDSHSKIKGRHLWKVPLSLCQISLAGCCRHRLSHLHAPNTESLWADSEFYLKSHRNPPVGKPIMPFQHFVLRCQIVFESTSIKAAGRPQGRWQGIILSTCCYSQWATSQLLKKHQHWCTNQMQLLFSSFQRKTSYHAAKERWTQFYALSFILVNLS